MSESDSSIPSHVLTNVFIVLERILKCMNARQLNSCARVCRTWRDQVRREKATREQMRWNCFIADYDHMTACWDDVNSFIKESRFEPAMVLMFCTYLLWGLTVDSRESKRKHKKNSKLPASELITPSLPSTCAFHIVVSDGIIGTDENMKTQELAIDEQAVTILLLGHVPGVEFVTFSVSSDECTELTKFWSQQNTSKPNCLRSLHNMDVKMLNIYCPWSGIDQEVSFSLFKLFQWPLIAGGFVTEKCLRNSKGKFYSSGASSAFSGMAVCGADVKVASVLIKSDMYTEIEVEKVVRQLKNFNIPLKKAFGLMYACVGRGFNMYGSDNVESRIFRKHFPQIPLFGFFGNGEIGCVYPPSDPNFRKDKSSLSKGRTEEKKEHTAEEEAHLKQKELMHTIKHPPKLLHAYTTVMCLVSLP